MLTKKILLTASIFSPIALLSIGLWLTPTRVLNALTPSQNITTHNNISYLTFNSSVAASHAPATEYLRLDVYQPRNSQLPRPVVVFFYGGSWHSGARADYRFVAAALAARGFVVVVPDYRLYPEVQYPQFLQDCAAAVAWTFREAAHYGGNSQRIYLMGHSAGAYNAAMLALDPRWLAAQGLAPAQLRGWIGLAGPYDFLPSNNPKVQLVFHHPHYPIGAQPIEYVRAGAVPAFIGAAQRDDLVDPQRNSAQLAQRLRAVDTPVTVKMYSAVDHLTLLGAWAWPLHWLAPVFDDVVAFLQSDV
jgi:acetyl esterase/lipase